MADTTTDKSSILDVLSGNKAVTIEVSISPKSIGFLLGGLLVVIIAGALVSHAIKNSSPA
jgi:hypothetical protein